MSSDFYQGMVIVFRDFLNFGVVGIMTASYQGAGFQSLNMIMDGSADSI